MHCYLQADLIQNARPVVCWTVQPLQDNVVRTTELPFSQDTLLYS